MIAEVYDSWYEFFRVTRELIKNIPAAKLRRNESTRNLVHLAIEVLNEGLRPHLTHWQARFRRWYEQELEKTAPGFVEPQDLQKNFPKYDDLIEDMGVVNEKLMRYRDAMRQIVFES